MSFAENLQYLRQKESMTQEQFAEKLEVSRQSVSKWESGASYPEMEKLLQICGIFHCSMDVLMQGDAQKAYAQDSAGYNKRYNYFSLLSSAGTGLFILGFSVFMLLSGIGVQDEPASMVCFLFVALGVLTLVTEGLQEKEFQRKHPHINDFYTEEEKDRFHQKSIFLTAAGIGSILIGVVWAAGCEGIPLPAGATEDLYYSPFLFLVAVGVMLLVWVGAQREKYNISGYNRKADPDALSPEEKKRRNVYEVICGCIMILATMFFLGTGFIANRWDVSWVAFPLGGLLCGIVYLVMSIGKS